MVSSLLGSWLGSWLRPSIPSIKRLQIFWAFRRSRPPLGHLPQLFKQTRLPLRR